METDRDGDGRTLQVNLRKDILDPGGLIPRTGRIDKVRWEADKQLFIPAGQRTLEQVP